MNLAEDEGTSRTTGRKRLVGLFRGRESISAGYSTEPQAMKTSCRGISRPPQATTTASTPMSDVEDAFEARTKLVGFFSVLFRDLRPSVEEAHNKTSSGHTCGKYRTDYPA
jgi:hypothetical protein